MAPKSDWSFPDFLTKLDKKLGEAVEKNKGVLMKRRGKFADDTQQMLFVAFYTHGVQGHIQDCRKGHIKYKEVLRRLNKSLDLRKMPKVSVEQTVSQPYVLGAEVI